MRRHRRSQKPEPELEKFEERMLDIIEDEREEPDFLEFTLAPAFWDVARRKATEINMRGGDMVMIENTGLGERDFYCSGAWDSLEEMHDFVHKLKLH